MRTTRDTKGMFADALEAIKNAVNRIVLLSRCGLLSKEDGSGAGPIAHVAHEAWLNLDYPPVLPERYHLAQGHATDFCAGFSAVEVSELAGHEALLGGLEQNHEHDRRTRQLRKEARRNSPVASPTDTPPLAKISNIRRFRHFRTLACHFFRIADDFSRAVSLSGFLPL